MEKKKALVCTLLFTIVFFSLAIGSLFIKFFDNQLNLYYVFCFFITGCWMGKTVFRFYDWLMVKKPEEE